jgi:integrase
VTNVTIHDLRRTLGCRITREGGIALASAVLGHGDIGITSKHYAHVQKDDQRRGLEAIQASARRSKAALQPD